MPLDPYQQVADEISAGTRDKALWVRAWAESGGNHDQSTALYVRYRVEQIRIVTRQQQQAISRKRWKRRLWAVGMFVLLTILYVIGRDQMQTHHQPGPAGVQAPSAKAIPAVSFDDLPNVGVAAIPKATPSPSAFNFDPYLRNQPAPSTPASMFEPFETSTATPSDSR